MKEELRAITKNQRSLDSAVMMSSLMPSEKYSCSAIAAHVCERKHGDGGPVGQRQGRPRLLVISSAADLSRVPGRRQLVGCGRPPTKRRPLRGTVRIKFLIFAAIADRLSRGIDAAGQCRIRHDPAAPDRGDEIVLADDAVRFCTK